MEEEELHKHTPNPNCCGELETETESCRSGWSTAATSRWLEMELPLGMGTESSFRFRLEKAVCSHGLFMMAPNHWDPLSNSLTRPLLLHFIKKKMTPPLPPPSSFLFPTLTTAPQHPSPLGFPPPPIPSLLTNNTLCWYLP